MKVPINCVQVNEIQYVLTMNKKDTNNKLKQIPDDDTTTNNGIYLTIEKEERKYNTAPDIFLRPQKTF